jgi:hypothetical protein
MVDKSKYHADLVTGAAIAQVFSGMIEEGIAYATLTNGQATVFFHVAEDDFKTLYYALTEPNKDVGAMSDQMWFRHPTTAVGKLCIFTLMSLEQTPRDQAWRHNAIDQLNIWETAFECILDSITESEAHS